MIDRPSFKKMVDLASHTNHGINIPSHKQTCRHILKMFKQQMCLLSDWLNVSALSLSFYSLYSSSHDRAQLWAGKLVWHVMHGRPTILMLILQSLATGLRSMPMGSGLRSMCSLVSLSSTQLTTVYNLGNYFSWFVTTFSLLCTR